MCVYNDERFVGNAIESILGQSFQDFEFIIVNDGSTDGTGAILEGYARKDSRVKIISQANAGTTAAANSGLSAAKGRYVARLDSDDFSLPHRLKTEVEFLDANPDIALVGGGSEIIEINGTVIGARNIPTKTPKKTLMHRCIYQQSDVMFRRDVVLSLGGYRAKFRNAQDYDLWLRISEVAGIAKLDTILGQWRLNGGGYTLSRAREQAAEVKVIKEFARQRREGGRDGYDSYYPPPPVKHRVGIAANEYDLWVGSILLQALRAGEARKRIGSYLSGNKTPYPLFLYSLTFMPELFLRLFFAARDYYLNRLK